MLGCCTAHWGCALVWPSCLFVNDWSVQLDSQWKLCHVGLILVSGLEVGVRVTKAGESVDKESRVCHAVLEQRKQVGCSEQAVVSEIGYRQLKQGLSCSAVVYLEAILVTVT